MTETLLHHLEERALADPTQEALSFNGDVTNLGDLQRRIEGVASRLLEAGLAPGDRVVLVHPNSPDFFPAFFGAQRAGGVAVPIFHDSGPQRVIHIADLCGARIVMPSQALKETRRKEIQALASSTGREVLTVADHIGDPIRADLPDLQPDQLACLQYTSGSTGDPKGVKLTHANLMTNIRQMIAGFEISKDDVFVSWLPVSHDMGLILMTLTPLLLGARLTLMSTSMASIRRWMSVIADVRGTFTAAPDFAYRVVLATTRSPDALDLSCLRVALNAAEQVRSTTIAAFESLFGIGPTLVPAYGLAEATVGVAGRRPGQRVKTDDHGLVSVGRPFPGVEVGIVDGHQKLGSFEVGEIVVRSPAATSGYFGNPKATAALHTTDGAVRTGDLGYLDDDGELFIVGRKKAIIIQAGRNISPQEIEEMVDQLEFVRRSAAVGINRGGVEGEQAWVFVEIRPRETDFPDRHPDMVVEVVQTVRRHLGHRPGRVYLVRPQTIPTTHNGKVQHDRLRRSYLDGALRREDRIIYPEH